MRQLESLSGKFSLLRLSLGMKHVICLGAIATLLVSPALLRAADLIAPSAPSALSVESMNCSHVALSWTGSTDDVGGSGLYAYIVQRWEAGALWSEVTIRA